MNIYLELFGYLGTALVLLSMVMTSVTKIRVVNMCGSLVSGTYAALCGAWPVFYLNAGMIAINAVQLFRQAKINRKTNREEERI